MTENIPEDYDPEIEEVDIEPFEGDPDFDVAPSSNSVSDTQDDEGDDDA